jgi:hypothetical protein
LAAEIEGAPDLVEGPVEGGLVDVADGESAEKGG